jgi:hypothetical protein
LTRIYLYDKIEEEYFQQQTEETTMSISLTIIPVVKYYDDGLNEKVAFDHIKLRFVQDYRIFEQIAYFTVGNGPFIPTQPLPKNTTVLINCQKHKKDKYETELAIALASDMKEINWPKEMDPFNEAIKAYIDALPAETPIVLYWE